MLAPHAAVLGIVADEIGELAALLHQVAVRESLDLLLEATHAEQFAQFEAGIVEAQRLVEIRREQEMSRRFHSGDSNKSVMRVTLIAETRRNGECGQKRGLKYSLLPG